MIISTINEADDLLQFISRLKSVYKTVVSQHPYCLFTRVAINTAEGNAFKIINQ